MAGVASNSQLGVTLVGKDQLTPVMQRVEKSTRSLDKAFGSLGARVKTGIQWHVINNGLNALDRVFRRIWNFLPGLISRGQQWAGVIDDITDATGMSARKASELAGVQRLLTGSADGLSTGFRALSKSVTQNQQDWKDLGVQIVRNRDGSVDAYGTFQNLRRAVAATGAGTLSYAAAQKLAGKGAADLLDILQLNDRQYRALAASARRAGLIMTEAGAAAAERWKRTQNLLDATLTGLGSQILEGIAPTLIGLTNAITDVIQKNMGNIVRFVSGAVQFVASMIGQFLGVDISIDLPKQIKGAGDAAERSAPKLRQQAAAASRAASAQRDLASSTKAVRDAERALAGAKGSALPLASSMSQADFILAQQARQASIAAAEDRVRDARRALREHRRTMQTMGDVNAAAMDRMAKDQQNVFGGGGGKGTITKGLEKTLADAKAFGRGIADAIQDAIFGPDTTVKIGHASVTIRSGGLITHLQNVGKFMADMSGHLSNLNGLLGGNGPLVLGILALIKLFPGGEELVKLLGRGAAAIVGGGAAAGWRTGRGGLGRVARGGAALALSPAALAAAAALGANVALDRILPPESPESRRLSGVDTSGGFLPEWADPAKMMGRLTKSVGDGVDELFRVLFPPARWRPGPGYGHTGRRGALPPWMTGGGGGGGDIGADGTLTGDLRPWYREPRPEPGPAPGFGFRWETALAAIFDRSDAGRSLVSGGTVPSLLERIESELVGVREAIGAGGDTGTASLTTKVANLEDSVKALAGVNGDQNKAIAGVAADTGTLFKSVKSLAGVNGTQNRDIAGVAADTTKLFNSVKGLARVNGTQTSKITGQTKAIAIHEDRLDRIETRLGIGNPDARAAAGAQTVVLKLDAKATRDLFTRGVASSSLQPIS